MLNIYISGVARPFPLSSDHQLSKKAIEYLKPFSPSLNAQSLPEEPTTKASAIQNIIEALWNPRLTIQSMKDLVQSVLTMLPDWAMDDSMVRTKR